MPPLKNNILRQLDWVFVLVAAWLLFYFILDRIATDIQIHATSVVLVNKGVSPYPPNFLYYFIVNVFSGFSESHEVVVRASAFVLSCAVALKYYVTKKIIKSQLAIAESENSIVVIASLLCLVLFAIPDIYNFFYLKQIYVSRIVPNVWHNSTTITLFPFAMLLFWQQFLVLSGKEKLDLKNLFILFALMLANVLIKPSFFFVYAPVTAAMLLLQSGISRRFGLNVIPMLLTALVLFQLQQMIYEQNVVSLYSGKSDVVLTTPFLVWRQIIPAWYIPIALVMSFILPLLYCSLFWKKWYIDKRLLQYSAALMVLALILAAFVGEQGPRRLHLNFFWQNVICCYLLNLVIVIDAVVRYLREGLTRRMKLFSIVFLVHALAGIFYFVVMFYRQHYR